MSLNRAMQLLFVAMLFLYNKTSYADTITDFKDYLVSSYSSEENDRASKTRAENVASALFSTINKQLQASQGVLRYGDRIRLQHRATMLRLNAIQNPSNQPNAGSPYIAVTDTIGSWWIVKGPHITDKRWTGDIWMPIVSNNSILRLEQDTVGMNLHSVPNIQSQLSKQLEVSAFGTNGIGDSKDNWKVTNVANRTQIIAGTAIKLTHVDTNKNLRSEKIKYPNGCQEVVCSTKQTDDNDWWVIEAIIPAQAADLNILYAAYGNLTSADKKTRVDVTRKMNAFIFEGRLRFPIKTEPANNQSMIYKTLNIQNPAPQSPENLLIFYQAYGGLYIHLAASEYDVISLPDQRYPRIFDFTQQNIPTNGISILYAVYGDLNYSAVAKIAGAGNKSMPLTNVTGQVVSLIKNNQLTFDQTSKTKLFSDPAPGATKSLLIVYRIGTKIYSRIIEDTESGTISTTSTTGSDLVFDATKVANLPNTFFAETGNATRISIGSSSKGALEIFYVDKSMSQIMRYNLYDQTLVPWTKFVASITKKAALASFKDVSISSDGVLFVLDGNGKAYVYDGKQKLFKRIAAGSGNASLVLDHISVGNSNAAWAVNTKTNSLYQYTKSGWLKRTEQDAMDVSVGVDGTIACINPRGDALMLSGNQWTSLPGANSFSRIAVGSRNSIYGISNGQLYQFTNNKWTLILGNDGLPTKNLREVSVNAANTVVVVDNNDAIFLRGESGFVIVSISTSGSSSAKREGKVVGPRLPQQTRTYKKSRGIMYISNQQQKKAKALDELRRPKPKTTTLKQVKSAAT